jgi:hypothetical protein
MQPCGRFAGVQVCWQLLQYLLRKRCNRGVRAVAAAAAVAAAHPWLDGQDSIYQGAGLLQLEGDVGVGVHAKHLGRLRAAMRKVAVKAGK